MTKILALLVLSAMAVMGQKARPQRAVFSDATQTTGTGDAIVLAPSPSLAALTDLDTVPPTQVCFVAEAVNTTTVTVAISGLTAKSLFKMDGAITTALGANDLRAGQFVCFVRYPTGDAFQMTTPASGTLNNSVSSTNLVSGTSLTMVAPRTYGVCTGTCTVTIPVPAAGYEFCILNGDNVSTAITLSAIGSSAMYENTARTAYGTAGTGTLVATAVVGNRVCLLGLDSTHYLTVSYTGTWTAN